MANDYPDFAPPRQQSKGSLGSPRKEQDAVYNKSVGQNTDVFSSDISPSDAPAMFQIQITLHGNSAVPKAIIDDGNAKTTHLFNKGESQGVNQVFIYNLMISSGETFNIQHDGSTQNVTVKVHEVVS